MIEVAKGIKPPHSSKEVVDVLIGEVALTRRKIESLLEVLDEKGVISKEEFRTKMKKKNEEERLDILMESFSQDAREE